MTLGSANASSRNSERQLAVGVDLGGTMIKAALVARGEGLLSELSHDTGAEDGPESVLDRLAAAIKTIAQEAEEPISGIGIGVPGVIDWERTSVIYPPNLPGWGIVNIREALRERLGDRHPVFVENDANVAGLGSAHYGAGRPHDSFIMITLGTGVGGAIIYENKIFRGTTGGAGEIGHTTIDFNGPVDRYGIAGAIEAYLGQRFLSHYGRYKLLSRTESLVHQMAGEDLHDLTPLILFEAAEAGDEYAKDILEWAGHRLGIALGSAVNLLDIRKVIVGGGMASAGDFIFKPARKSIVEFVMPDRRNDVEIIRETLGNEVGMLGAAHLVFQYLDEHAATVG